MNTFLIGSLYLMFEILLCESIFAWSCPKRKYFVLRVIISVLVCLTASYFYPRTIFSNYNLFYLTRVILELVLSYLAILFCFKIKPFTILIIVSSGDAVQHIGGQLLNILRYLEIGDDFKNFINTNSHVLELIFCVISAIIAFALFGRKFYYQKYYTKIDWRVSAISISTIFICVGLNRFLRFIPGYSSQGSISSSVFCILCCYLALILQFNTLDKIILSTRNIVLDHLLKEEKIQFEENKQLMVAINKRSHDLKHLLEDYGKNIPEKYRNVVKDEVDKYDNRFLTSNSNLDVLLTSLYYKYSSQGVVIKLVGNSDALTFIEEMDLVMLFDNALINAINAVLNIEKEKRTIQIIIAEKGNMVSITFINYFKDTKTNSSNAFEHGIGLTSIETIALKYKGSIDIDKESGVFSLNIYLFKNK